MILNRQHAARVKLSRLRSFEQRLAKALKLGRQRFDVCLVDDPAIAGLNAAYRGEAQATDVLSFPGLPFGGEPGGEAGRQSPRRPCPYTFLGDIAISTETARRNARAEGHSLETEICWLILHGALHLLGYDHETDHGEMSSLELSMRRQLRIAD